MAPKLMFIIFLVSSYGLTTSAEADQESEAAKNLERNQRLSSTIIGAEKLERQIGMVYKLDLAKDNNHGPAMVEVMKYFDESLRTCYVDRLEENPSLKGSLIIRFKVSKNTGTMQKIKRLGGNITDKTMYKCLKKQLAIMPFDPPRDLRGTLYYRFAVF